MSVTPTKNRPDYFDVVVWERKRPGERPRKTSRRVKGKRAAEKVERELLNARDHGQPITTAPTLSAYAKRYFASREHEVSARTMDTVNVGRKGEQWSAETVNTGRRS